jgi:hypothetical protein
MEYSKLKLSNTTDFPDERIREIIKLCKPRNLVSNKFTVRITNSSGGSHGKIFIGRLHILVRLNKRDCECYPIYVDRSPQTRRPYRRIALYFEEPNEKTGQWETWYVSGYINSIKEKEKLITSGGYISQLILSREESLISVIAHELRHLWQVNRKYGKVWGSRGQFSDRDADYYAINRMRAWRRLHNHLTQPVNWNLIEEGCFCK